MFYRVINPTTEPIGKSIDSRDYQQSPRKLRSIELLQSYQYVCRLSECTNIRLSTAINVAINYGWNIELIQERNRNGYKFIPLNIFCVSNNEPIKEIPMVDLVNFIVGYNAIYEKTGIFIDELQGDESCALEFMWEYVRQQINDQLPSRLLSCFLFDDLKDAKNFKNEDFNQFNKIVKIEIKENRNLGKFDMNWLTDVPVTATFKEAYGYAYNYWQQQETENPIWEYLCDCIYTPLEIDGCATE
jgi:hypothetical protein